MFTSHHVYLNTELFRREAQTWETFTQQLAQLKQQQNHFASLSVPQRTALLSKLADRLAENRDILANMICEEVGRCLRECQAELDKSVELIRYYARLAPELLAHKTIATQASLSQVRFEPLGVVLAIMPWNYPVWQILRFAIPALCAGNACMVKPALSVARVTQKLFDVVGNDLPFIPVWLANEDIEQAIAHTDAMAFTGSTEVGRLLASYAGKHLKKTVLELGGSNPFIVLADADLAQAAKDACYSRFRDAGQSCNAAKRIVVENSIAEEFTRLFLAEVAKLKSGDPADNATTLAPMHTPQGREKVHQQVLDAIANGARLLCGGEMPSESRSAYPATVLDNVTAHCRLYHEEAFGPVVIILHANDAEHTIKLANDTQFGLGASIYSANEKCAWKLGQKLETGAVYINRHTSSDLRLPFGGVKQSGYGRELSEFGLYEFVNIKTYWQK